MVLNWFDNRIDNNNYSTTAPLNPNLKIRKP